MEGIAQHQLEGSRVSGGHTLQQAQRRGNFILPLALRLLLQEKPNRFPSGGCAGKQQERSLR